MTITHLIQRLVAPPSRVYRALTDARDAVIWMVPAGMRSQVHEFEPRIGGAFRISLTYEAPTATGKTSAHTDTYHGRFIDLVPNERVVQVMEFETADASMRGEMTVTFMLGEADHGTDMVAVHENVPPGVSPADNELVSRQVCRSVACSSFSFGRLFVSTTSFQRLRRLSRRRGG